jgi:hypothetical protein
MYEGMDAISDPGRVDIARAFRMNGGWWMVDGGSCHR